MAITIDKTFENIWDKLIEKNQFVKISSRIEEEPSLGKVICKDRDRIYLLPYVVWEPVIGIQRARLEKTHYKPLLIQNLAPEPISENYIKDLIMFSNYLNSRKVQHKNLRERLFNPKIYLMPDKEMTEMLKREFNYNESREEFKKPDILIMASEHEARKFLNGKYWH